MKIDLNNNRHAFLAWAGITVASSAVCFGVVAASGNLATASEPVQVQAWESSHTVESLATPYRPDIQRVCHLWDGHVFHTPDATCDDFGYMDVTTLEVGALGLGLQNSYEHCSTNDGWGDDDCVLANVYGSAFIGSWIYNG